MTNTAHKQYAVLTADIVHSTKLNAKDYALVMKTLQKFLTSQAARYRCTFEIFRGDSFQVLYTNVIDAMNSVLLIRLYLQSGIECPAVRLTQSIAIGRVEQASSNLSSSLGEAFILSGRALDTSSRGSLVINFGSDLSSTDLTVSTLFLRHMLNGLTEKQAEVLYYYINFDFPEQRRIADHMNMTRQNVATHLKRSGAELVRAYLESYRETFLGTQK